MNKVFEQEQDDTTMNTDLSDIYGTGKQGEKEARFAMQVMEALNNAYTTREKQNIIFNDIDYSSAYEYNRRKSIGYFPPAKGDKKQVTTGMVHEKVIGFSALMLRTVFTPSVKVYNSETGEIDNALGEYFEASVEKTFELEKLTRKLAPIYFELYSQGDAFVEDVWEVKNITKRVPVDEEGEKMQIKDYTYKALEGYKYKDDKIIQRRSAVTRLHDGRSIILFDTKQNDLQQQPAICIEERMSRNQAEKIYGNLIMWEKVPKDTQALANFKLGDEGQSMQDYDIFGGERVKMGTEVVVHRIFMKDGITGDDDKGNRFNIFINGVKMLPMDTPMTLLYPRGNYPLSQMRAEEVSNSAYSRSIPMKVKFNADFIDDILKKLARKFHQGIDPAILNTGNLTLTSKIFDPAGVTKVSPDAYVKADPDNKGITNSEFSFYGFIKEIIEGQTLNATTSGEISKGTTAYQVATVQDEQIKKLAYILNGMTMGYMQLIERRIETIESKLATQVDEVKGEDGEDIPVYQNFTVSVGGVQRKVEFKSTDDLTTDDAVEEARQEVFSKEFMSKQSGMPESPIIIDPNKIIPSKYEIVVKIKPEPQADTSLQKIAFWQEVQQLLTIFPETNREELKRDYLEMSGKSERLFEPAGMDKLQELQQQGGGVQQPSEKNININQPTKDMLNRNI